MFANLRTLLAAGLIIGATAPAALADPAVAVITRVTYSDLDLSNPAGAEALVHRISAAVNDVCGRRTPHNIKLYNRTVACRAQAFAGAIAQINAPLVTSLFNQQAEIEVASR